MPDRYHSHTTVYEQTKLKDLNIALIGSGPSTHYFLAGCCGLGIGHVHMIDDRENEAYSPEEFLFFGAEPTSKLRALEQIIKELNNDMAVHRCDALLDFNAPPQILLDFTNSKASKSEAFLYAKENEIPLISASVSTYKGTTSFYNPKTMPKVDLETFLRDFCLISLYKNKSQKAISAGVIASIALDNMLKFCLPLPGDKFEHKNPFTYNMLSKTRIGIEDDYSPPEECSNKRILIVGAGSLGTFAALAVALTTKNKNYLDIIDCKVVSEHNLNRQVLYARQLEKKKAEALKQRLKMINPNLTVEAHYAKIAFEPSERQKSKGVACIPTSALEQWKYDIIISCLDNNETRHRLNKYAVAAGKPLVTGSSDITRILDVQRNVKEIRQWSDCNIYIPNKNSCWHCQVGDVSMREESEMKYTTDDPLPGCDVRSMGIITPNMIAGTLQASEALFILSGKYPDFDILAYNNQTFDRIEAQKTIDTCNNECQCHKNERKPI